MPTYQDEPKKMENLFPSTFAVHDPTWANVQTFLNTLCPSEECQMVLEKANEEDDQLCAETSNIQGRVDTVQAVPTVYPNWNVSDGVRGKLEHYQHCILAGLKRGVQRNF